MPIALLTAVVAWLRALSPLVKIPLKIGLLLAAMAVLPVPDWASSIPSKIAGAPATVQYMLYMSQLSFGLLCIGSAYALSAAWNLVAGVVKGS